MTLKQGDIALINIPYASGRGQKVRPTLVIQRDDRNFKSADTIVVVITSQKRKTLLESHVLIDPSLPDERASGL